MRGGWTVVELRCRAAGGSVAVAFDPAVEAEKLHPRARTQRSIDPDSQGPVRLVSQFTGSRADDAGHPPRRELVSDLAGKTATTGRRRRFASTTGRPRAKASAAVLFPDRKGAPCPATWGPRGPGQADGHRDHQRLGAGRRAALNGYARRPLSKAGLRWSTFDPQGQGSQKQRGPPDNRRARRRSTTPPPFFDAEDAIDFASHPAKAYDAGASFLCESGRAMGQAANRRAAGVSTLLQNPFWKLLDPARLGHCGHSKARPGCRK